MHLWSGKMKLRNEQYRYPFITKVSDPLTTISFLDVKSSHGFHLRVKVKVLTTTLQINPYNLTLFTPLTPFTTLSSVLVEIINIFCYTQEACSLLRAIAFADPRV